MNIKSTISCYLICCLSSTPLFSFVITFHEAVKKGNIEQCILFLEKGPDVNQKDEDGNTPLYCAVERGFEDISFFLIQKGADLNQQSQNWDTPLHCAVKRGSKNISFALMEYGADVSQKGQNGDTPLYCSLKKGFESISALLIALGADEGEAKRQYEKIKIAGYLNNIESSNYAPTVIINLILSFSL